MDYILLNGDGSIKSVNFTDFIQQNNDGVNEIFVSCEDLDYTSHSATAVFVLPDGSISEEPGVYQEDVEYKDNHFADGYLITLTQNETKLSGLVFLTINIKNISANTSLYSYRATITINKTADQADLTYITLAQYLALKDYVNTTGRPINVYFNEDSLVLDEFSGAIGEVTPEYLEENYVPYANANDNLNLGRYNIHTSKIQFTDSSSGQDIVANDIVLSDDPYHSGSKTLGFGTNYTIRIYDGDVQELYLDTFNLTQTRHLYFPDKDGTIAVTDDLPKKNAIGTFNTSSFTNTGSNYVLTDIPLSGFIDGSDLLIITWGGCFAICPIPASGPGRVCAAMWDANGEAKTIRVRYELKSNNTLLDIALQGGFVPPSNFTGYVINYKIA